MRLRIYTASKVCEAEQWIKLRGLWPEFDFTAHWPDLIGRIPENVSDFARRFWEQDVADVLRSDVVLVYPTQGQSLRGALVEAGMAIGAGKRVLLVGDSPEYGTWQHHPLVCKVADLEEAHRVLTIWAEEPIWKV